MTTQRVQKGELVDTSFLKVIMSHNLCDLCHIKIYERVYNLESGKMIYRGVHFGELVTWSLKNEIKLASLVVRPEFGDRIGCSRSCL